MPKKLNDLKLRSEKTPSQLTQLQNLQAKLREIQRKQWMMEPLTVREENLVAEMNRHQIMKPQEQYHEDGDQLHFEKTLDIEPMLNAIKDQKEVIGNSSGPVAGAKYVGSVDEVTAANWAKEWGCAVGTKEFGKLAVARIKLDSNFAKFGGR